MANLFSLSRKPFVVCYCFREPIQTFFLDACQMIVKSQVLNLFLGSPNWKKLHNKHLISLIFFGPYCKLRILIFFHWFMACVLRTWAINRWKKLGHNLQYGPKTLLIRGIYLLLFKIFPRLWLAKSTCIIHHNQLLMTKFGRILCLTRKWHQKCSVLTG